MKLSLASDMRSLSDDLDAAVLIASLLQSKTADEYLSEAQECIVLANQCSARGDRLGGEACAWTGEALPDAGGAIAGWPMMKRDRDNFDDRIQEARGKLADAERVANELRRALFDAEAEEKRARSHFLSVTEAAWEAVMLDAAVKR